jgi:hypothetical protein
LAAIFLLLSVTLLAAAQTTKVRGRVTDTSGEGIPFAGVYFENTTIGITTDLDGYYYLETRDLTAVTLIAQLLGYNTATTKVTPGVFNQRNFVLEVTDNELTGARVKADNRKARRLLANIDANRHRNDPDSHPEYVCDIYNKMELDLTHPREQLLSLRPIKENFPFLFDYIDTSTVSGVPYLPIMLSETVAERRHRSNPAADNETVKANRISGINPKHNLLTQFTGNLNNFNVIFLLNRGQPQSMNLAGNAGRTDLLVTWLYKMTVTDSNYKMAAVIGIMVFLVTAVISLVVYNTLPSVKDEEGFQ